MKSCVLFGLILLASCTKTSIDKQESSLHPTDKQSCDFGMTSFNLVKRSNVNIGNEVPLRRKPNGGNGITTNSTGAGVIYLDFNGETVTGTSWNFTGAPIECAPANLTVDAMNQIVDRVTDDFSPFNIIVTTDEAYFLASTAKKTRVIVTESWEWWGMAGGVAFMGTFTAGSTTPCFVFSSLLNYSTKAIAEASSHESGHTIGLYHQSSYDVTGTKTSEYNSGQGTGEIGWAPIMGNSYSKNLSLWHKGSSSNGSNAIQDDIAVIKNVLGNVTDDYSNTVSGAAPVSTSLNAVINSSTDVDFFSVNLSASKTVAVTPFNVGLSNAGSNVDLVLKVYNSQGNLIATTDYAGLLNASTVLAAGSYYISVSSISNSYTTTYGMAGKYTISLN